MNEKVELISPGNFRSENHWYPKALNATIHPMVNYFLNLSGSRIVSRYCHLHPMVKADKLEELLAYRCKYFLWGGADLINATSAQRPAANGGNREQLLSFRPKKMPLLDDNKEDGSYRLLIERTFKPMLRPRSGSGQPAGRLAVIYDKIFWKPAVTPP